MCVASAARVLPLWLDKFLQFCLLNDVALVLAQRLEFCNDIEFNLARRAELHNWYPMHVDFRLNGINFVQ